MAKQILTMKVPPRPPRILYIGSGTTTPGITYLNALKDSGFNVFHIGEGSRDYDTSRVPKKPYIVRTPTGQASVMIRNLSLKSILDIYGYDFDVILHVQDWTYFTETEFSPIPYYFYCTEIAYTFVHKSVWFVLAATQAIKDIILQDYPWLKGIVYHPHSVLFGHGEAKYPEKERVNSVFFAGELYRLGELYEERRKVVHAVENCKDASIHYLGPAKNAQEVRKAEKGLGLLNSKQYIDFLLESKIGVNVPTIGGANFRDFEIPGSGAMLLTRRTPDMDFCGFQDGVNCRFYDTPEEAKEIVEKGYDPEIARAGWDLIVHGRKWYQHTNLDFIFRGNLPNKEKGLVELIFDLTPEIYKGLESGLENLKLQKIIQGYRYLEKLNKLFLEVSPEDAESRTNQILLSLGFREWAQEGHTINHRMKELALLFNKMIGINYPQKVMENIPK